MTKYQSSIDGLQRILDEYPGTQHGFDYAFLSEEESKRIIREARDAILAAEAYREATDRMVNTIQVAAKQYGLTLPFRYDKVVKPSAEDDMYNGGNRG